MTAEGAHRDVPKGRARASYDSRPDRAEAALRGVQAALALWLLVSPFVLDGANGLVAVKDVLAGGLLLTTTLAAAAARSVRRFEGAVCVVLGAVLITASVLLEFGPGQEAALRQWNEVVVGVLLVCLGAARTR